MKSVIRQLTRVALLADGGNLGDAELLGRFLSHRDEAAFEALLRRHGPLVLGVCRRVLGNAADAEDAFQATFLVLVRKAAALRSRELLGGWLHGVAYRTALKAKVMAAKRRRKESEARQRTGPPAPVEDGRDELLPLLDRELARMPEKYRVPVVLCELEGRGRKEVARRLGIPEGTLSSRLAAARKMLARRLKQGGTAGAGAALTAALGEAATAGVPRELLLVTARAAARVAAGRTTAGLASTQVITLTEGVMKAMLLNRLKLVTAVVLAFVVTCTGAAVLLSRAPASDQAAAGGKPGKESAPKPAAPANTIQVKNFAVEAVDVAAGTVTVADRRQPEWRGAVIEHLGATLHLEVTKVEKLQRLPLHFEARVEKVQGAPLHFAEVKLAESTEHQAKLLNLPVAKDVAVALDGKPGKLADLKTGMAVDLGLSAEDGRLVIKSIQARRDGAKK
jgi:RNA polymerase sigma factor (sigma-70 family)